MSKASEIREELAARYPQLSEEEIKVLAWREQKIRNTRERARRNREQAKIILEKLQSGLDKTK